MRIPNEASTMIQWRILQFSWIQANIQDILSCANLDSKVSHHHHSCQCLHMTFRTAKDITRRRWRSDQQRTFNTKPWRSKHYLLEVHGPWILVEFSGLLLEIATIAFVFKVYELDSPFLNILKLWSHLQISPCFALRHKIMSLLSSFVLFCLFFSVQEELRKIKGCNKNRWLVSYYKRICKQETQSQCSENLQFYIYLRRIRCCEHANGFKRHQKIAIFINNCVCKNHRIASESLNHVTNNHRNLIFFLWSEKGKEMKLCAKGVDGWWAVAITPFDFADIVTVASIFPCDFSKQQSSVLSLPSFLPSLLPSLHCTALRKGESDHRRHSLRVYIISTEFPKGTHRVSN
jgi:hypothetical protein